MHQFHGQHAAGRLSFQKKNKRLRLKSQDKPWGSYFGLVALKINFWECSDWFWFYQQKQSEHSGIQGKFYCY